MNIGLFFGSFNPIHIGHLIIANHLLNETSLEKIWLIISPLNPFKIDSALLSEYIRLDLAQEAIKDDQRIIAKDIEFQLPRPSFTINTLKWLKENYPDDQFSIIMGSDSFQNIDKWKDFGSIIDNYKILIYLRPGYDIQNRINARIEILNAPLLGISSTEIRELIKKGKSICYLVPESVKQKIEQNKYYTE